MMAVNAEEPLPADLVAAARAGGATDQRLLDAIAAVPRAAFAAPELADRAHDDIPLPIPHDQVTTQTSLVAPMVAALELTPSDRVLEVGTGFGWQTALLARLAGYVWSVERWDDIADTARAQLTAFDRVTVAGDGSRGLPERAPYDAILVAAAFPEVPPAARGAARERWTARATDRPRRRRRRLPLREAGRRARATPLSDRCALRPALRAARLPRVKLALAGDTMLGRMVAERLTHDPRNVLFAPGLVDVIDEADVFLLNLECCISARGEPWPGRVFHFRAPPWAADVLAQLGVDCVTLANNHALDFGEDALLDTLAHLDAAGIRTVGAGTDLERARAPALLDGLTVVAFTDHPRESAATPTRPGVAFGAPESLPETRPLLVTPHWGANMTTEPARAIRKLAGELVDAGATLIAGHSAHVFHGVAPRVLYDLGDFIDDYRVDPKLRNDLGLLFLVDLDADRLEAVPLKLELAHTRLATGEDSAWITLRFTAACAAFGTDVSAEDGRLVTRWR
jgi:protein-L-isoaspartate(D-aspartate) O-methyltransferase